MQALRLPWHVALGTALAITTAGATGAAEVLMVGGERSEGRLVEFAYSADAADRATARFAPVANEPLDVAPGDLVRYGAPAPAGDVATLLLTDGSTILAGKAWVPGGVARIDERTVSIQRGGDWTGVPREKVALLVLDPAAELPADADPSAPAADGVDRVFLEGGDVVEGRVVSLSGVNVAVEVAGQSVETPLARVEAIRFASPTVDPRSTPHCLVGLADGTLLRATTVEARDRVASIDTATVAALTAPIEDVALVQPVGEASGEAPSRVVYLSDLEPADYRHTPYFDVAWPLGRDTMLSPAAPLAGGITNRDGRWAKGLSMHSASRAVYTLDGGPRFLRGRLAVASDPERSKGSVVFRVYGAREGRFERLFESDIVRGGDPPIELSVDLTGASAVALVIDYADRGDEADEGQWLDARLER
jgi:hypothetical protein